MDHLQTYTDKNGTVTLAKSFEGDERGPYAVVEHTNRAHLTTRDVTRPLVSFFPNLIEAHGHADAQIRILMNAMLCDVQIKLPDDIAEAATLVGKS